MDPDPWVTCPYNEVHRVPRSRLQGHIVKCQKQYPKLAICPYNATHRMDDAALKKHIASCPSREALFPDHPPTRRNGPPESTHGDINTPKPFLQKDILPETDPVHEIWDD